MDQQPFETGFDAAALAASKLSTSATGSAAAPLADPVAGCAFKQQLHHKAPLSKRTLPKQALPKQALIGALRAAITKIEGHGVQAGLVSEPVSEQPEAVWRFGCPEIDCLLPEGLDPGGVHEVKSSPHAGGATAGAWMAGLGFALRLAVRRTLMAETNRAGTNRAGTNRAGTNKDAAPWLLWCWTRALASEFGAPSALGLAHLGLDPSRLLIVEPARVSDALVVLEDGLKSSSLALVFGIFDDIALTPARRLSLAAAASRTPCLLITHPAAEPSAATSTRWRVQRRMSAPHDFDAQAPGRARFLVNLERCRAKPQSAQSRSSLLEWCDETCNFSLASSLADSAPDAGAGDGSRGRRRSA